MVSKSCRDQELLTDPAQAAPREAKAKEKGGARFSQIPLEIQASLSEQQHLVAVVENLTLIWTFTTTHQLRAAANSLKLTCSNEGPSCCLAGNCAPLHTHHGESQLEMLLELCHTGAEDTDS